MIIDLIHILNACNTVHKAEEEANKKSFFHKKKDLKEINNMKQQIAEKIKDLFDNCEWNVEFICELEQTLLAYYHLLDEYSNFISVPDYRVGSEIDTKRFYPIYFVDVVGDGRERYIILEVIGDNINIDIADTSTGNHMSATSTNTIHSSQTKIVSIFKKLMIDMITNYLNNDKKQ